MGQIDHNEIAFQLSKNLNVFQELLSSAGEDEQLWKPDPNKWCLLEIVCHLVDEEKDDFRQRVQTTLFTPGEFPPPIDPVAWVKDRKYMEQSFQDKKSEFIEERKKSIHYLQSLQSPNWDNSYEHVSLGTLSARMFVNNWIAHDYIHIRQILKVKHAYLMHQSGVDLGYAGNW